MGSPGPLTLSLSRRERGWGGTPESFTHPRGRATQQRRQGKTFETRGTPSPSPHGRAGVRESARAVSQLFHVEHSRILEPIPSEIETST